MTEMKEKEFVEEIEYDAAEELETGISASTIVRTIALLIVLLNQVLVMAGKVPLALDEETIYTVCSGIATIGVSIWTWWKNNSFTKKAREADLVKNGVKETA